MDKINVMQKMLPFKKQNMRNRRKGSNRSFKIERKRKHARDESPRHLGNPV